MIDADALIGPIKLLEESYRRCGSIERAEAYANCLWEIEQAPTVDVLQKLWNALYAEEDKLEGRYFGTPEHDNWFLIYRPWLQDGFGIAIKAMSEILTPEPPEEKP